MSSQWRGWFWLTLVLTVLSSTVLGWALAQPWRTTIELGELYDRPFVQGFHRKEYNSQQQVSFRWSHATATLTIPGSSQQTSVQVRLHPGTPAQSLTITSGTHTTRTTLHDGWQNLSLPLVPATPGGDATLTIQTSTHRPADDPRDLGIVVDYATVQGRGTPAWGQAVYGGLSIGLVALLTQWATRRPSLGVAVAVGVLGVAVWAILADGGQHRLLMTSYTGRLLLVLLGGTLLAAALSYGLRLLRQRGGMPWGAAVQHGLAVAAVLAFVLRFAAVVYPLTYNSDLPIILGRTWMVREGQLDQLFFPNPALTPVQWDDDVTIPRSPFYYIITTPLTLIPPEGTGDKIAMMAFSSSVDALMVVVIGILVGLAARSGRAAVASALVAAMLPLGLLFLVSWGTLPTLLGQLFALTTALLWVQLRPRLHERRVWLLFAACLTVTFLAYPTALLFLGLTGGLLLLGLTWRHDAATRPTATAALAALLVAFGLYYVWHLPTMLSRTLPTLVGGGIADEVGGGGLDLARLIGALVEQPIEKFSVLLVLLAVAGALLLLLNPVPPQSTARDARLVLACWALAFVPMALADELVLTFILKHLLHLLPIVAGGVGLLLAWLSYYRTGRLVAGLLLAWLGWQAVLFNVDAIVYGFVQLK